MAALLALLQLPHGWKATRNGMTHDTARVSLVTWNGWLTCAFAVDSVERFPLSVWESFNLGRAVQRMHDRLIAEKLLPEGGLQRLDRALTESIWIHSHDWEVCTDVIHHRRSGVELVTRDGPLLLRCSPMSRVRFGVGILGRFTLWFGVRRLIRQQVAERFARVSMALQAE